MIPFIDLAAQQARIKPQIDQAIERVLEHGIYIMGPEVGELERKLCDHVGSQHCITVSNGTDALVAALMAYDVGPGDAVITTPFTFFATVEAIMFVGATPVFADIDPNTLNICPHEIETVIADVRSENRLKLRGIIPVDLFGQCADYGAINQLADQHGLFVIQDAAQSFGAGRFGTIAPNHADIGTTSFFPAKPLGCYGDGGAIFTNDDRLADILRSIRVHGKGANKYDNVRIGQNGRLDTIQAAILLEKLKIYPSEFETRQSVATMYVQHFEELNQELDEAIIMPSIARESQSAWAQFTIRVPERESIIAGLRSAGIPSVVYYRTPSHLLGACSSLGYGRGDFPNAESASLQVLSIPFHPYLSEDVIANVVDAIRR